MPPWLRLWLTISPDASRWLNRPTAIARPVLPFVPPSGAEPMAAQACSVWSGLGAIRWGRSGSFQRFFIRWRDDRVVFWQRKRGLRLQTPGIGGGKEIRTPDPLLAKQMLYQLSYAPAATLVSSQSRPSGLDVPRATVHPALQLCHTIPGVTPLDDDWVAGRITRSVPMVPVF